MKLRSFGQCAYFRALGGLAVSLLLMAWITVESVRAADVADEPVVMVNPAGDEFIVVPRIPELTYYPCAQCHGFMTPNPEVRELFSPHPANLQHGNQRIWCLTCHKIDDRNLLTNLLGEPVDFDRAAEVCASCHMQRHKDWMSGGHGKRVANWQGERVIYSCPHCHDPHDPSIKPRAPKPLPPVRKGLERDPNGFQEHHQASWERLENKDHE